MLNNYIQERGNDNLMEHIDSYKREILLEGTMNKLFAKYENLKIGEKKQGIGRKVPLGYMGSPKDITGLAVFLASDESRYITAGTHKVDGGGVWV